LKSDCAGGDQEEALLADFQFEIASGETSEGEAAGAVGFRAVQVGGAIFEFQLGGGDGDAVFVQNQTAAGRQVRGASWLGGKNAETDQRRTKSASDPHTTPVLLGPAFIRLRIVQGGWLFAFEIATRETKPFWSPESYISLESALVDKGITSQSPSVLICVTPAYPQSFRTKSVGIVYRKISPDLYWGYEEKATRYNKYLIAEPEKALLDWIYLNRQEGLPTPFDELQLQFLGPTKLRKYAVRFPRTVLAAIKDLLLEKAFPLEDPDHHRRNKGRVSLT